MQSEANSGSGGTPVNEQQHTPPFESLRDTVLRFDREGRYLFVSENFRKAIAQQVSQCLGRTHRELGFPETQCRFWEDAIGVVLESGAPFETEFVAEGKDGVEALSWRFVPEGDDQGVVQSVLALSRDNTERKQAEAVLRESESKLRAVSDSLPGGLVYQIDSGVDGQERRFTYLSAGVEQLHGITAAEALADAMTIYSQVLEEDRQIVAAREEAAKANMQPFSAEVRIRLPGGETRWRLFSSAPRRLDNGHLVWDGIEIDISKRKRAEEERERLQAQLLQVQKMESIGRLAGGVAHDFNNMLSVILGHTELALNRIDPSQPIRADLEEIRKAAARSADLTRQLLAFARKQTVTPKVLDLNETVAGMLKMLSRLIGEYIELTWQPGVGLWPIRMDPSQLDQILANLCVNARDAISGFGKISISTENSVVDEVCCSSHPGVAVGEYVALTISDTGSGMDKDTLASIFEPFFTTKEMGKGTGLGLATVYGIVKQNSGFVDVCSEPGRGATFRVCLPRHVPMGERLADMGTERPAVPGHETILLVEDEPAILSMTTMMLEHLGFTVLATDSPGEALRLAERHAGQIHLLMTDVIMPEMNGRDLAKNLLMLYPGLNRLFMSGYSADVIAPHGVLAEGVHFLQKPFSMQGLAAKVREALGGG